ncbi:MAG: hypothetical protein RBR07_08440 [Arcobacteraceae bacterium]|nr:hypothetical protein [Arcobacteraceae bacterium]
MDNNMIDTLINILIPQQEVKNTEPLNLYCIFDGLKYEKINMKMENEWKIKYDSLFEDKNLAISMNYHTPYICNIPISSIFVKNIISNYGMNGCIFFWSKLHFKQIIINMQNLFVIYDEDSKGYLKYYNPHIFNIIMKKSSNSLINRAFKDIECYFCEDDLNPQYLYKYTYHNHQIQKQTINLKD